ncbi:hypothetical protein, partial [Flavobacterium psychrophilum]
ENFYELSFTFEITNCDIKLSPAFINKFNKKFESSSNIWNNVKMYTDEDTIIEILNFNEVLNYVELYVDPWEGQDYDAYLRDEMNYTIEDSYRDGGGGEEWSDPDDFWG